MSRTHLYQFQLQVRTAVLPPLVIDFAVYQDAPIVFLKGVRLMPGSELAE